MEKVKNYITNSLIGVTIVLFYFYFNDILLLFLNYIGIKPSNFSIINQVIYLLSVTIFMLCTMILIYHKELKKDFINFKNNFKEYFNKYNKYWLIMIFLMTISSWFVSIFTNGISQNETLIRNTMKSNIPYFIYTCISCSLIAPIMEEIVFRKSIKKIIPTKYLFIIISGLLFGSMHVLGLVENPFDYLYILPYSIPGFVLAYTYEKSNNIFVPIGIHFFHNTVLLIIQIFLMLGGAL